jgi:hypothetical protein
VKLLPTSFRLSRKLLIVIAGVVVLTGASGAAAILVGREAILGPPAEEVSGAACTTVTTVRVERDGQSWLRKYVRSDAKNGEMRVKTALRVAGAVSNHEDADLYQIVLLDAAGPVNRADMRGRAIGAEVLFSRNPSAIPGMAAPFVARYVDGQPGENGEFYGERKELTLDEIKTIVTAMQERSDCIDPDAEAEAGGHAEAKAESGHEAPPEEHAAAATGHEEAPNEH